MNGHQGEGCGVDPAFALFPRVLRISRGLVLLPGILRRTDPSLLLHRPDLSLLHWPNVSLVLHRRDLSPGILYDLRSNVRWGLRLLHGLHLGLAFRLYGPELSPGVFLLGPGLEFIQQAFGRWLTDVGRTLIGSSDGGTDFVARRRFACNRRQSLSAGG